MTSEPEAAVTSGSRSDRSSHTAGSSEATTQWPSRVIPTGITSYLSRSIALSTPAAVAAEIACSPERPPNSSATRTLSGSGPGSLVQRY